MFRVFFACDESFDSDYFAHRLMSRMALVKKYLKDTTLQKEWLLLQPALLLPRFVLINSIFCIHFVVNNVY
jgi:hypothetical protein